MNLTPDITERMGKDAGIRRAITKKSHEAFFAFYLPHYLEYQSALFHHELFAATEDRTAKLLVVQGFRNSGKSTILSLSFPLWLAISGQAQEIIIICKNQMLARHAMKNIQAELEENEQLTKDFYPFDFREDASDAYIVSLKRYRAEIVAVSREQSVRGLKHRQYRPQAIIIDDPDDIGSVKTLESRENTWQWMMRDIVPLGDKNTRIVVIGSPLHGDSLIMRLHDKIESGQMRGLSMRIPILDQNGKPAWPAKFPTQKEIQEEKMKMDEISWNREMMLLLTPELGQLVTLEDIVKYNNLPPRASTCGYIATWSGVDFAIGQKPGSDYTAIVTIQIHVVNGKLKIYVLPNPVNRHLDNYGNIAAMKQVIDNAKQTGHSKMFMEANLFQVSFYQQMIGAGYNQIAPVTVSGDKLTRLQPTAMMIKDGRLLFPKEGCRDLIFQLVDFGSARKDDLADALSLVVNEAINEHNKNLSLYGYLDWVESNGGPYMDIDGSKPTRRFQSLIPEGQEE